MDAWGRGKHVVPADLQTKDELLAAPEKHSLEVHGDDNVYPECAECRQHCRNLLKLFHMTPQIYVDSFAHDPVRRAKYGSLYHMAQQLAEEDQNAGK